LACQLDRRLAGKRISNGSGVRGVSVAEERKECATVLGKLLTL